MFDMLVLLFAGSNTIFITCMHAVHLRSLRERLHLVSWCVRISVMCLNVYACVFVYVCVCLCLRACNDMQRNAHEFPEQRPAYGALAFMRSTYL